MDAFLEEILSTTNKRPFAEVGTAEKMQRNLPASPEGPIKMARHDTDAPLTKYASEKTLKPVSTPMRDSARVSPTLVTSLLGKDDDDEAAPEHSITQAYPVDAVQDKVCTAEERFTEAQAIARQCGKDPSLKWKYDENDELQGATCGGISFSRDELLQLSSCWARR